MNRNGKDSLAVFLLISAVLNLLLIQLFFLKIKPDPETLKSAPEEKTYIELVEIPVREETEPPEKTTRLAEKSRRAEVETTRDEVTKLSRSIPRPAEKKTVERKRAGAVEPGERKENKERLSFEKDQVAMVPEGETVKPEKKKAEPSELSRRNPEKKAPEMQNPDTVDVPYDYKADQQLLGAKAPKKSTTVDLNTTEYKYISYFTKLKERIYQVWKYPKGSQMRREQGNTKIIFILSKDGYLEDVRIVESSGFESLDREVLRTIKVASPYNPFPKSWEEETIKIPATFDYRLPTFVRYYN